MRKTASRRRSRDETKTSKKISPSSAHGVVCKLIQKNKERETKPAAPCDCVESSQRRTIIDKTPRRYAPRTDDPTRFDTAASKFANWYIPTAETENRPDKRNLPFVMTA